MNYKAKYLKYDHVKAYLPDDCIFNISPSAFAGFVQKKHEFYRQQVLKIDPFLGSTASVLGVICHSIAAAVANKEEVDVEAIESYVDDSRGLEDFCAETVLGNYEQMATELVNSYVIPNMNNYLEVESTHIASLGDGIYVSGSLDVLEGAAKYYKYT